MSAPAALARGGAGDRRRHARTSSPRSASIVTGSGREKISSPVGIVQGSSDAAKEGTDSFLWVLGLISLSIALLNLLPFLPLDGGHIVFAIVEGVRGRTVAREVYERVSIVGIGLVLLLFVIGLTNDIGRLSYAWRTACLRFSRAPNASGSASAASSSRWYSARVTSTAPSETSSGVAHWTSSETRAARGAQQLDEPEQRRLRGAGPRVVHRLGREEAAARDAVEPAGEPFLVPGLDRVRPARLVQPRVGGDEVVVDPAVRPARVGTAADHLGERGVDPDLEPARRPAERSGRHGTRSSGDHRARARGDHQTSSPSARIGKIPAR